MFSRILSGKKNKQESPSSHASTSASLTGRDVSNAYRSPRADKQTGASLVEGPRSALFTKHGGSAPILPIGPSRASTPRSASPPSATESGPQGVGVFGTKTMSLVEKKSSEPNVLLPSRGQLLRKANSQPVLQVRKSTDYRPASKNKSREDGRDHGFLERAVMNAIAVPIDEAEHTDSEMEETTPKGG